MTPLSRIRCLFAFGLCLLIGGQCFAGSEQ